MPPTRRVFRALYDDSPYHERMSNAHAISGRRLRTAAGAHPRTRNIAAGLCARPRRAPPPRPRCETRQWFIRRSVVVIESPEDDLDTVMCEGLVASVAAACPSENPPLHSFRFFTRDRQGASLTRGATSHTVESVPRTHQALRESQKQRRPAHARTPRAAACAAGRDSLHTSNQWERHRLRRTRFGRLSPRTMAPPPLPMGTAL